MTDIEIRNRRLRNQGLAASPFERPEDAVRWLGAVQSQDYAGAKWGLGLRMRDAGDETIDRAFNEGSILRTHALRPTWHFLAPADIRWVLDLTAPRVHALNALYYRKMELDRTALARCRTVLVRELRDGAQRTREELGSALEQAGIAAGDRLRLTYIMMHAELEALICSGPRRGKQFTYMLLDERVPAAPALQRDEALGELIRRYFQSHGPATVHDFVWWSGLTVADARRGVAMMAGELIEERTGGTAYWFTDSAQPLQPPAPMAYLLPNYDEYGSYKHRDAIFDPEHHGLPFLSHAIVLDGKIIGSWRRALSKKEVTIETNTFAALGTEQRNVVEEAAERYGEFLGLPAVIVAES